MKGSASAIGSKLKCPKCHLSFIADWIQAQCPHCHGLIEIAKDEFPGVVVCPDCSWELSTARGGEIIRATPSLEEKAAQLRRQAEKEKAQTIAAWTRARKADMRQTKRRYEAALRGDIFDADILVTAFREDWLQVQKDTGLTPAELSQDIKVASPAVGVGVGYLTGDPLIGLLAGLVAFLASDEIAEDSKRGKLKKWQSKWQRVFLKLSEQQINVFSETLAARYPLVWRALAGSSDSPLLEG